MNPILWLVVALLVAGAIVFVSSLATRRQLPAVELPDGEKLPKTALQQRAAWALLAVMVLSLAAVGSLLFFGAERWWDDDAVRLTFTFLLLAALGVYLVFSISVRSLAIRDDGSFDERDTAIMARSCAGVGGAMMVVVAAWMIGLVETYHETRLIPSYYLSLIFWSLVMTNVIASLAGILLAYRRS
ncbi:MAG: hypothetical protein P8Y01_08170 [Woeseiaceae bacterium]|jgi:hypothetical protein